MALDPRIEAPFSPLVCVYYRVAASDCGVAIAQVRDFQRTLRERHPGLATELLVRSDRCPAALAAAAAHGSDAAPAAPAAADATLMETYRLPSPAPTDPRAEPAADCSPATDLLADIASVASPLAPLLRSPRHVEVFSPCAW